MSTTFDVYPGKGYIPLFSELLYAAEKEVNNYLREIDVNKDIKLNARIQSNDNCIKIPVESTNRLIWDDSYYAWFYIKNVSGGTDAYFYRHDELYTEFLLEELSRNPNFKKYETIVRNNIRLDYRWTFRRSVGQPAIIGLCYGFLAATLAKLTDGIIYTDDGAWDYEKFPADPNEFLKWYFRLEYATKQDDIDFAIRGIASIKNMVLSGEL